MFENRHIKSLYIDSYRGIKNLKLDGFTGINIFTGDNNSGKTSVMEILNTLGNSLSITKWNNNVRTYGFPEESPSLYEGFLDLFDINQENKSVSFTFVDSFDKTWNTSASVELEKEIVPISKVNKLTRFNHYLKETKFLEAQKLVLSIKTNEKCTEYEIYDFQDFLSFFDIEEKNSCSIVTPVVYISPTEHDKGILFLDEVLNNPILYQEMLEILKDFDEDILSINHSKNKYNNYYAILSKKYNKALPLNVYGDGMKKAVLLMTAVVKANNGILLIDEFETAIHTSVMNSVYSWILKTCKKLNVQVFLTTHSDEALGKILSLNDDELLADDISLYTLFKKENNTLARRLSALEALEAKNKFGQELR